MAETMPAVETPELKQLEFVRSVSVKAVEKATVLANTASASVPSPLVGAASAVYERVAPTVEPYAKATIDAVYPRAESALVTVDGTVDFAVTKAKTLYNSNLELTNAQFQRLQAIVIDGKTRFEATATEYFKMIDEGLRSVKGKLTEASSVDAVAAVTTKMSEVKAMLADMSEVPKEKVLHHLSQLQSAWESLMARKEVTDLLELSNSSVKSLTARAEGIHDTIVTDPRYSELLDKAGAWISWAQATSVGSKLTTYATPYATLLSQTKYGEAAAPYATRVMDYWKPCPPLEGIKTK